MNKKVDIKSLISVSGDDLPDVNTGRQTTSRSKLIDQAKDCITYIGKKKDAKILDYTSGSAGASKHWWKGSADKDANGNEVRVVYAKYSGLKFEELHKVWNKDGVIHKNNTTDDVLAFVNDILKAAESGALDELLDKEDARRAAAKAARMKAAEEKTKAAES